MSIGALIHRQPVRSAASAIRDAERAIDEAQRQFRSFPTLRLQAERSFAPQVSAVENEGAYLITAELPGVDPADLDVSVEDGVLTINGQRRLPRPDADVAGEEGADEEDTRGRFQRRYRFNGEIDEGSVQAKLKHGVLTVSVPKPEVPEPEARAIQVEVS